MLDHEVLRGPWRDKEAESSPGAADQLLRGQLSATASPDGTLALQAGSDGLPGGQGPQRELAAQAPQALCKARLHCVHLGVPLLPHLVSLGGQGMQALLQLGGRLQLEHLQPRQHSSEGSVRHAGLVCWVLGPFCRVSPRQMSKPLQ